MHRHHMNGIHHAGLSRGVSLWRRLAWLGMAILLGGLASGEVRAAEPHDGWRAMVSPENALAFVFFTGNDEVCSYSLAGWGANWSWVDFKSAAKTNADELALTAPFEVNKAAGQVITVKQRAWKNADAEISFQYDLSADKDVPLTTLAANISVDAKFQQGDILCKHADGSEGVIPLAGGGAVQQPETRALLFRSPALDGMSVSITPPLRLIYFQQNLRIQLASDTFKAGTKSVNLTFHLPAAASLLVKEAELAKLTKVVPGADWFPVTAGNDVSPSVIGCEGWLDKPAGKHGGVRMVGDHYEFEDHTPVKFWGTNLAFTQSAPEKKQGEYTAARFAKYGVNGVRMHKFTGSGWSGIGDPDDATNMTPDGLDRLDYFANELAKRGIYYGWSHSYHYTVKPGNKDRLLAYDEIKRVSDGDTYQLMNYAEDCQDLLIETVVNLLKHKNPYTGKTYAEDPALSYIEIQNEDDIFFYLTSFDRFPTYTKHLQARFSQWLQEKYTDQAGLQEAWGTALQADETLAARNIAIYTNPWPMSVDGLQHQTGGARQRRLDNAAFFHAVQNAFYSRFVTAIRATGYKGPLVGSAWEAASGLPHLYNLKSDYQVGVIDRHNYFEGARDDSALTIPGCGLLSAGFTQVADRPFQLSEWTYLYPMDYTAEAPATLATYGLGLQGWNASYEFESMQIGQAFSDRDNAYTSRCNTDLPTQIGQFPALARMIMRGDVQEGAVIGVRHVSPQNLATGTFDFKETVKQHGGHGDVKSFSGDTPISALAAGKLVLQFTEKDTPSFIPDMSKYEQNKTIVSTTKQLTWDYTGKGYFTVNSAGTKAVVGFAREIPLALGSVQFTVHSPFASLYFTSLDKTKDLSTAGSALLSAVARNSNSGCIVSLITGKVLDPVAGTGAGHHHLQASPRRGEHPRPGWPAHW